MASSPSTRPDRLREQQSIGRADALLAMTAEALKTITSPMTTSISVAKYSHLSTPTRFAIACFIASLPGGSCSARTVSLKTRPRCS